MQQFLTDYGLWLLIGLLIVIALVFLITRGTKADATDVEAIAPVAVPETMVAPQPPAIVGDLPVIPVAEAAPAPIDSDDLLRLKGIGPKLNTLLISLGVTRFQQIADWTDADLAQIDTQLGTFRGRPVRDQWIDQAKYLASGDVAGFEAKYGKL